MDELSKMKSLSEETSVKDDLNSIYTAIQEVGYVNFSIIKLLDKVHRLIDELKLLVESHENSMSKISDDVDSMDKNTERALDDIADKIKEIREEFDELDGKIKSIRHRDERATKAVEKYAEASELIITAAKEILSKTGYDPETGKRLPTAFRDWESLKTHIKGFVWNLILTAIFAFIMWKYAEYNKAQVKVQRDEIQNVLGKRSSPSVVPADSNRGPNHN